jgi:hypothetical protein
MTGTQVNATFRFVRGLPTTGHKGNIPAKMKLDEESEIRSAFCVALRRRALSRVAAA